jgi:hypothetical protein
MTFTSPAQPMDWKKLLTNQRSAKNPIVAGPDPRTSEAITAPASPTKKVKRPPLASASEPVVTFPIA